MRPSPGPKRRGPRAVVARQGKPRREDANPGDRANRLLPPGATGALFGVVGSVDRAKARQSSDTVAAGHVDVARSPNGPGLDAPRPLPLPQSLARFCPGEPRRPLKSGHPDHSPQPQTARPRVRQQLEVHADDHDDLGLGDPGRWAHPRCGQADSTMRGVGISVPRDQNRLGTFRAISSAVRALPGTRRDLSLPRNRPHLAHRTDDEEQQAAGTSLVAGERLC